MLHRIKSQSASLRFFHNAILYQPQDRHLIALPPQNSSHYNDYSLVKAIAASEEHKRIGVLGVKLRMMRLFDENGQSAFCTPIHIDDCRLLALMPSDKDASALSATVGIGGRKEKKISERFKNLYLQLRISCKRVLEDFEISPQCQLPLGWSFNAGHFLAGQHVDVRAQRYAALPFSYLLSIGLGTQGVMRRWGFKGLPATHGVTKKHRAPGSIGCHSVGEFGWLIE